MNPIYELTDHAHSEEELAPWLDVCGTGRETIDGLLLTALDCAWGNWKAAAKPPMHPYANPAYLRAAETSPWRWDDCLPAGLFTYGLDTEQWHRIIAAMNDLGRFGLSDTAIVRRDLMDGEESVLAIRDNWEVADFDACEWSDPNAADPYICVVYDLRRLAEDEDGKPRRVKGTMRWAGWWAEVARSSCTPAMRIPLFRTPFGRVRGCDGPRRRFRWPRNTAVPGLCTLRLG